MVHYFEKHMREYRLKRVIGGEHFFVIVSVASAPADHNEVVVSPGVFDWMGEGHRPPLNCEYLASVVCGAKLALTELALIHGPRRVSITELKYLLVDITHFASMVAGYQAMYLELVGRPAYEPLDTKAFDELRTKFGC